VGFPTLQLQNATDLVFFYRLRIAPFEGPASDKPPALPEVADFKKGWISMFLLLFYVNSSHFVGAQDFELLQ
jgi:hypothetical protein